MADYERIYNTKKPKSLTISYTYPFTVTFGWENTDTYDDYLKLSYAYYDAMLGWIWWGQNVSISKNTTSYSVDVRNTSSNNQTAWKFEIYGKRNNYSTEVSGFKGNPSEHGLWYRKDGDWHKATEDKAKEKRTYYKRYWSSVSDTASSGVLYLNSASLTGQPSVTVNSQTSSTFSWDAVQNAPFTVWEYQTQLITNYGNGAITHASYVDNWSPVQSGPLYDTHGSATFTEQGLDYGEGFSYTRWIRVKALSRSPDSGFYYASHTYAQPPKATITYCDYTNNRLLVRYISNSSEAHPISTVKTQHRLSIPVSTITETDSSVSVSLSPPIDNDWTDSNADSSGNYGSVVISDNLDDKAIYVRIKTQWDTDDNVNYSDIWKADNGYGKMKVPEFNDIEPISDSEYRVTIKKNTSVERAFTVVWYRTSLKPTPRPIGIIPYNSTNAAVLIPFSEHQPGEQHAFGIQACVGTYSPKVPHETQVTNYSLTSLAGYENFNSEINWDGGTIPIPPKASARKKDASTIEVQWERTWEDATQVELSWSTHADAWESTDAPTTYIVANGRATSWNISGLSIDEYYIRVRLIRTIGESSNYSSYSNVVGPIQLAAVPTTPSLVLDRTVVPKNGSVRCSWLYSCEGDPSVQASGILLEAYVPVLLPEGNPSVNKYLEKNNDDNFIYSSDTTVVAGKQYYSMYGSKILGDAQTSPSFTLDIEPLGWESGETHYLCVGVTSSYGINSEGYSTPVPLRIADEITNVSVTSSLDEYTYESTTGFTAVENPSGNPHAKGYYELEESSNNYILTEDTEVDPLKTYYIIEEVSLTELALTELPLTVSATHAGPGETTTFIIERDFDFPIMSPTGDITIGHAGEMIAMVESSNDTAAEITKADCIGSLNDNARYRLYAIVKDAYGQSARSEDVVFTVHWSKKAVMPEATIEMDASNIVAYITPLMPSSGYHVGDTCDIYRRSADKSELIVKDAVLGEMYVDPYPTLGTFGGYTVAYKTDEGNYTIANSNGLPAWRDYTAEDDSDYSLDIFATIIDFGKDRLELPYDISVSNSWTKEFTETKYLGGDVVGDWNPAVSKSVSVSSTIPVEVEPNNIRLLRRLAVYSGVCHIRTPDGSSFSANIDVKDDREEKWVRQLSKVSLTITRVESEEYEGMTYSDWLKSIVNDYESGQDLPDDPEDVEP